MVSQAIAETKFKHPFESTHPSFFISSIFALIIGKTNDPPKLDEYSIADT